MTWFHTPAISPEQGAVALIAIVIVYGLGWVVYRMLTYREPEPDAMQHNDGDYPHVERRNG
jgi:hypothetical protein